MSAAPSLCTALHYCPAHFTADRCGLDYKREDNLSLTDTRVGFTGLESGCTYRLTLYITNTDGEFDQGTDRNINSKKYGLTSN